MPWCSAGTAPQLSSTRGRCESPSEGGSGVPLARQLNRLLPEGKSRRTSGRGQAGSSTGPRALLHPASPSSAAARLGLGFAQLKTRTGGLPLTGVHPSHIQ